MNNCYNCKHHIGAYFVDHCRDTGCSELTDETYPGWEPKEDEVKETATAYQVGGSHYQTQIQPVDFIVKNNIKWREANVIKYVFRHEKKNKVEDLKKARHYLDMLIEEYDDGNG